MVVRGAIVAGAALGLTMAQAMACSCERPPTELNAKEHTAWTLERAEKVVRGDIVSVQAGVAASLIKGAPVVHVRMNVREVLKGEARTGDVTLMTLFGIGDCGLGPQLLAGFGANRELTIEVKTWPEDPNIYYVDMCGYGQFGPGRSRVVPQPQ